MEIGKGTIAKCSAGAIGLITVDRPQEIIYADGNKGCAWTGIQLTDTEIAGRGKHEGQTFKVKMGDPWSSRDPQVLGFLGDVVYNLNYKLIERQLLFDLASVFQNFCDKRDLVTTNDEKQEAITDGNEDVHATTIYGPDWDELLEGLTDVLSSRNYCISEDYEEEDA